LTEFLLDATIEGSEVLGTDAARRNLWRHVRQNIAPYPTMDGPFGRVWLDVRDAPQEHVYNVPVTLAPVFPGEQVGLDTGAERLEIARRTARTVRLEGGNDLVWQPLARARLGMLDLEWFKREVQYSMTPLGVANDRVRQAGGRYRDDTDFDFMMRMGVWTENLSLPAVINECLLQSYSGVIRLFPNTINLGPARFERLRAAGAFLVSAFWDGTAVTAATLTSEKGSRARIVNPWRQAGVSVRELSSDRNVSVAASAPVLEFETRPNESYVLERSR
jgi:hypothetical protein